MLAPCGRLIFCITDHAIASMGPFFKSYEDFTIKARVAYNLPLADQDETTICKIPTTQQLGGKVISAYEELFHSGNESDFTFVIGDEEIKAHKAILSARFPYFATMMSTGMVEAQTSRVKLDDVDAEYFKQVLKYVYFGKMPREPIETARHILPLADRFLLPDLKDLCLRWMESGLSKDNVCETLIATDLFHCVELKKKCLKLFNQWKSSVSDESYQALEAHPRLLVEVIRSGE